MLITSIKVTTKVRKVVFMTKQKNVITFFIVKKNKHAFSIFKLFENEAKIWGTQKESVSNCINQLKCHIKLINIGFSEN